MFSNAIDIRTCIMYVGYLCGQCRNDKGVSALLNKCVSCGKASVLLIIALGRQYRCNWIYQAVLSTTCFVL